MQNNESTETYYYEFFFILDKNVTKEIFGLRM